MRIASEPDARAEDVALIRNAVDEFNMTVTGDRYYRPISIFLRNDAGTVLGGVLGDAWGGWLHVTFLWVAESLRGQRYGAGLLEAAENEARALGCRNVFLETFSFQARPFYERMGYEVYGQLADYPPGHTQFYLRKALAA